MRHPPTILRMHPVTLRGLGCSHEYVVGHGPVGSRIRGNDVMGSGMTFRPAGGETGTSSDTGRVGSRIRGNDVMGSGMTVLRGVRVRSQFRVGG